VKSKGNLQALSCRRAANQLLSKARRRSAPLRVTRSLYSRAVGYNYEAVKIFMPANREKPVYAKYIEHIPPDVTACIFWLKNRDPQHWRDSQQLEHSLGRYLISDTPMSEEEWARERAAVLIDDESPSPASTSTSSPSLPATSTSPPSSPPTLPQRYPQNGGRKEKPIK
jgi:hypothetical protein